jgi:hypothetical protein
MSGDHSTPGANSSLGLEYSVREDDSLPSRLNLEETIPIRGQAARLLGEASVCHLLLAKDDGASLSSSSNQFALGLEWSPYAVSKVILWGAKLTAEEARGFFPQLDITKLVG